MSVQPLFHRDFTLMVAGQIISLFGNAILRFALSLYVLDLTGSAALFGGVLAVSMIPTILLSPVGGVLADRLPRHRIMYALDFLTAALVAGFGLVGRTGSTLPPALLMLCLSAIQACYQPATQSAVPLLAPLEELTRANGVVTQVYALSSLLGPIAGGWLYGVWGMGPICAVSAGCFFASAVMECFLHIPFTAPTDQGGIKVALDDLRQAGQFLSRSGLLPLLAVVAGVNLFLSSCYVVGLPYLVKIYLGLSSQLYSYVEAAMGLGTILGALLTGILGQRLSFARSARWLFLSALSLCFIALSVLSPAAPLLSWGVILLSALFGMACAGLFSVLAQTFLQRVTPTPLLGKMSAFVTAVSTCAMPLGQGLYGIMLEWFSAAPWVVFCFAFAACLPLVLLASRLLRADRQQLPA
ncbi:MFS transporter [Oscillospiraceae bacterium]|nr:MFS transporter [Oscillospiraceae bacterium]